MRPSNFVNIAMTGTPLLNELAELVEKWSLAFASDTRFEELFVALQKRPGGFRRDAIPVSRR
jgi:hypothetical protein